MVDDKKTVRAKLNAQTRREWRELGFFYDRDDSTRRWRLVGARRGLARLASLLESYAADPRNARPSEHAHHSPHSYLKIMTWSEPRTDDDAIAGRLEDLGRLAGLVAAALASATRS